MGKLERWFDEGAPLFRETVDEIGLVELLEPSEDYYMCPSCMVAFPREAIDKKVLTVEHVPPESVGGEELMLTCASCNHGSGSAFDSQAAIREAIRTMLTGGDPGRRLRMEFEAGGVAIRGLASHAGDRWVLRPTGNHPATALAHSQALRTAQESGDLSSLAFRVSERFSNDRATVSWIRAAYFAAFIALGWRYIFQRTLIPVRALFGDTSRPILPSVVGYQPDNPPDTRKMTLIESPDDLESVFVTTGQHSAFLPDPWGTHSWEQLSRALSERRRNGEWQQISGNGKDVPWPLESENRYRLDRGARNRSAGD